MRPYDFPGRCSGLIQVKKVHKVVAVVVQGDGAFNPHSALQDHQGGIILAGFLVIRKIFLLAKNQAGIHILGDMVLCRYMPIFYDHRRPHFVVGSLESDGGVDPTLGALHRVLEFGL